MTRLDTEPARRGPCKAFGSHPKTIVHTISQAGMPMRSMLDLQSLGLLTANLEGGILLRDSEPEVSYFGRRHTLQFPHSMRRGGYFGPKGKQLPLGMIELTSVGLELLPIAGAQPDEEYRSFIVDRWRSHGLTVVELPGPADATGDSTRRPRRS